MSYILRQVRKHPDVSEGSFSDLNTLNYNHLHFPASRWCQCLSSLLLGQVLLVQLSLGRACTTLMSRKLKALNCVMGPYTKQTDKVIMFHNSCFMILGAECVAC